MHYLGNLFFIQNITCAVIAYVSEYWYRIKSYPIHHETDKAATTTFLNYINSERPELE